MRTVMIVLGIVFLVLLLIVGGCFALLYWAHDKGEKAQDEFFEAVLSGEPMNVTAMFAPELKKKVDVPVLGVWMAAVKEHLGAYQGMSASNFSTKSNMNNGVTTVETSGTVNFEKGNARSTLKTIDGKIVAFKVTSDALPDNWFTELDDIALYDGQARKFFAALLDGGAAEAMAMMHPSLREKFTEEGLAKGVQGLQERMGKVSDYTFLSKNFKAGPPQELELRFRLDGEKEDLDGLVKYAPDGMKMHLVAFKIPAE